jgi:hypothetical protein
VALLREAEGLFKMREIVARPELTHPGQEIAVQPLDLSLVGCKFGRGNRCLQWSRR